MTVHKGSLWAGTTTVLLRELRPTLRDPISVVFNLGQPLIMLALFGPLLTGMPGMPTGSVWKWFVPGILVMVMLNGTSGTGANLLYEMQTGSHERLLVTPLPRSALLIGRSLKELTPLTAQALLIMVAVLPFGFRPHPLGAVLGVLLLGVLGVGIGALSYSLALASKGREWIFWVVTQTLLFPVLILSGMLLPLNMGPAWLRLLAAINPMTYIVDAERALFVGHLADNDVLFGAVAAVAVAAVGLAIGIRTMRAAT